MVLDIIIAILILGSMVQGYRKGFLHSLVHTVGWFISLVFAFIWSPQVKELIIERTGFDERFHDLVYEKIALSGTIESLPEILSGTINDFSDSLSLSVASSLTDVAFSVISFLLTAFVLQTALRLITSVLGKKSESSITGIPDGLLGLLSGLLKGILYAFILLAVMFPISAMADPLINVFLTASLETSRIASFLYDNNLILLIVKDLL